MKKTIWALALAGAFGCGSEGPTGPAGPAGPQGMPGDKGDPGNPAGSTASLSVLQPASAFLGRQVTLEIGGSNTNFSDGKTKVDFGDPNIKVDKVTVASPTLLKVQITVGPTDPNKLATYAKIAAHDVSVTTTGDKTESLSLKGAFNVASPLVFTTLTADDKPGGKLTQGGIGRFIATNLDYVQNPFNTQSTNFVMSFLGDGIAGALAGSGGQVAGRAFIDVKASKTPNFAVQSPTPLGTLASFVLPAGQDSSPVVAERTPVALTLGTAVTGKLMAKDDTTLYKTAALPMGDQVVGLTVTRSKSKGKIKPVLALLPDSGKWADQYSLGGGPADLTVTIMDTVSVPYFAVAPGGGKESYLVVADQNFDGGDGFEFGVTAKSAPALIQATFTAGTKPDAPNKQIDLSKGANYFKQPNLASHTEQHYYEFTVPAMMAGPMYAVLAPQNAGDPNDPTVDVLDGNCKTGVSLFGNPIDNTYFDAAPFSAKAGHTYCIVIGDTTFPFSPMIGGGYTLLVTPSLT